MKTASVHTHYSLFLLLSFPLCGAAQNHSTPMLTGEFYLRGVTEVASGFRFNADSTFDFYFMYGAVDRFGKGTFEQLGDSLILHSTPKPERDFILVSAKTIEDQHVVIRVADPNPMVLPYVLCQLETPDTILQGQSDQEGYIRFDKTPVKSIALLHQLWPDRPSVFPVEQPELNSFEFTLDPKIVEVDFNGIVLRLTENTLTGRHPLLDPGKTYRFEKQ